MPTLALAIAALAAVLHALWNLLAKRATDSSAFMWWGVTVGALWYGLVLSTTRSLALPPAVWPTYLLSLVAEITYVWLITWGYSQGDLSQVYPLARGTPPLLIAAWGAIALEERLPLAGYAGIGLLVAGIYLASLATPQDLLRPLALLQNRTAHVALAAAACVAVYTMLDKSVISTVDPLVYNFWVYAGISLGYSALVWAGSHRAAAITEIRRNWRPVVAGSFATVGSYLLALVAMTMTTASYVGAVRSSSVLIGAFLGHLVLGEGFGRLRVMAAAVIAVGLIAMALAT